MSTPGQEGPDDQRTVFMLNEPDNGQIKGHLNASLQDKRPVLIKALANKTVIVRAAIA